MKSFVRFVCGYDRRNVRKKRDICKIKKKVLCLSSSEKQITPFSNIMPLDLKLKPNETSLEKRYREVYTATWIWLDKYWESHNLHYLKVS